MDDAALKPVYDALMSTPVSHWMRNVAWAWPLCESIHFIGLSLLMGTVGLFDLRLLGFARGVPMAAFHRLIPIGVGGFLMNVTTGLCFLSATPDQYFLNRAFHFKVVFLAIAGLNVAAFYLTMFRTLRTLGPGDLAPLPARVIGGVSLAAWIGVMSAGRLLTFFRPL